MKIKERLLISPTKFVSNTSKRKMKNNLNAQEEFQAKVLVNPMNTFLEAWKMWNSKFPKRKWQQQDNPQLLLLPGLTIISNSQ